MNNNITVDKIKTSNSCPALAKEIYNFINKNNLIELEDFSKITVQIENDIYGSYDLKKAKEYSDFHKNYYFSDSDFECNDVFDLIEFKSIFIDVKENIFMYLNKKYALNKSKITSTVKYTIPPAFTGNENAYKKVGNNNLDILPTGRDYGLIFT
jgi:hypothetical protein